MDLDRTVYLATDELVPVLYGIFGLVLAVSVQHLPALETTCAALGSLAVLVITLHFFDPINVLVWASAIVSLASLCVRMITGVSLN